jgi:hypothetical protein
MAWTNPTYESILREHQNQYLTAEKEARADLVDLIRHEIKKIAKGENIQAPSGLRQVRIPVPFMYLLSFSLMLIISFATCRKSGSGIATKKRPARIILSLKKGAAKPSLNL